MTLDLKKLKEIAGKAQQGDWRSENWRVGEDGNADCGIFTEWRSGMDYAVARCPRYETEERWQANAAHIAAFGPPTALALIGDNETLRAQRDAARALLRFASDLTDDCPCENCTDLRSKIAAELGE